MFCLTTTALQHISQSRHRNTLQHTTTHCNTLQHTATHYNTLQHTAAHCNTLQHTALLDFMCVRERVLFFVWRLPTSNGVATISRLLKIIGLFCKRAL